MRDGQRLVLAVLADPNLDEQLQPVVLTHRDAHVDPSRNR
jgi:hypothetical protein